MTTPQGRLLRIVVLQMILTTASERPEWMQKILGDTKNALLQRLWKQQASKGQANERLRALSGCRLAYLNSGHIYRYVKCRRAFQEAVLIVLGIILILVGY